MNAESSQIGVGDVVFLKSGGPAMTVSAVGDHYGTQKAWCDWFDGKKALNDAFPLTSLRKDD